MQNKGLVWAFASLMAVVCLFYLSFSFVTRYYDGKAEEIKQTEGQEAADRYLDSLTNNKVYFNVWTLRECREQGIGLGLDLKGGMNVILEVSVPDVIKALADHKEETDESFRKAVEQATSEATNSQDEFITLFIKDYKALEPNKALAELFATQQLRDKVTTKSTDDEVKNVLRAEVQSAIDNSYNVLRTRIDRFGVAQPNIQFLPGQEGRIMVEMPGVKEPERVRKLLQGSANLEFWETYNTQEIVPFLVNLDAKLAAVLSGIQEETPAEAEETAVAQAEEQKAEEQKAEEKADTAKAATDLAAAVAENTDVETTTTLSAADIEKVRKQHPLLSRLQPAQGAYGCVVGYANKRDMAAIDELLASAFTCALTASAASSAPVDRASSFTKASHLSFQPA